MNELDKKLPAYRKNFKYDFDNFIMLKYYPKRIISRLNKGNLLELGLGHGYTVNEFLKHVSFYTILEGSEAVINNFKQTNAGLYNKVKIIHTYFEDFTTINRYENIVMGFILEHVEDPDFIINKYKNFLAEYGKLFITVPNSESLHRLIAYEGKLLDDLKMLSEHDLLLGHRRYYNLQDLKDLAKKHKLKIIKAEGIFLKPFATSQMINLNLSDNVINGLLKVGKKYPELSNAILMELTNE